MSDDDALFALARAETRADAPTYDDEFTRAIEKQVRVVILQRESSAGIVGGCSLACPVRHFAVDVWKTATGEFHACIREWCLRTPALHVTSCRADLERHRHALVEPASVGGGVYFCSRHARVHICSAQKCRHAVVSAHGMRVCPLSARTFESQLMAAYGTGNTLMSQEITGRRELEETRRRDDMTLRRSVASVAIGDIIRTASTYSHQVETLGKRPRDVGTADAIDVYVDMDLPDDSVFPERGSDNTFGDDIAPVLCDLYTQAYAAVTLLLFSDDRVAIETRNRQKIYTEATQRLVSYRAQCLKNKTFATLTVARQLETRVMNSRRVFPDFELPPNVTARLTAYYALVCMEMQVQLTLCAKTLHPSMNAATRKLFDKFCTTTTTTITPNVLAMLVTGMVANEHTVAVCDKWLAILMPEPQTIQELHVTQRACTECTKSMKAILTAAARAGMPQKQLQITQLDDEALLFTTTPVISLFLAARRARLTA